MHAPADGGARRIRGETVVARLAEHLPKLLAERGFEVAFGIPTTASVELFRGLAGSGLRCVTTRSTLSAGFMADGYARLDGNAAVCLVPHGPGLAAIAPAAAQALADGVPMLIVSTSQPATPDGRRGGHRRALRDPAGLVGGVTLASRQVQTLGALAEAIDEAAAWFATRRRGPLHIEIPDAALLRDAGVLLPAPVPPPTPRLPAPGLIAEVIMRLGSAERPVLIMGGGAVGMGQANARQLAERLQAPVLLTSAGRGLIPPTSPLLGCGNLESPAVKALMAEADAVLAIGTELSPEEWGLQPGETLGVGPDSLVRVDIDPDRLYQSAAPAVVIAADARLFAEALIESMPQRTGKPPDLAALRNRGIAAMPHLLQRHRTLIDAVWEHLPEGVLVGDVCEPTQAALMCAAPPGVRRWLTAAAGFALPGWGLAAAIGAKIADPRRPVVALMGDVMATGAIGDLATAVETNAHVVLLVWNNTGLGEVRERMKSAQIKPFGVDLSGVDLQPIARGLGAAYARVHGQEAFREALRSAIMRPGPSVLELREDYWFG